MKTKTLVLTMKLEVEENKVDEIKKLEHHAEYLLDLDNYPEIKAVSDVTVSEVE